MSRQLYRLIRSFETPDFARPESDGQAFTVHRRTIPAAFALTWPGGSPAVYAEMFLQDISARLTIREIDGGSLKTFATGISHLLRYAHSKQVSLLDLHDRHMRDAIHELQDEADGRLPFRSQRNSNTVERIVEIWIEFLRWLQSNIAVNKVIADRKELNPQIPLEERTYFDTNGIKRTRLRYRLTPAPSTTDPKGPISRELRVRLWDAVQHRADPSVASPRYRSRFSSYSDFIFELTYLRKRRELMLELFEHLGPRPKEIAELLVSDNERCTASGKLRRRVMKRRRRKDPLLDVPIAFQVAVRVELFASKYRKELLDRLRARGLEPTPRDRLFLAVNGAPITEQTLEKEFRRIAKTAEIQNERACLSMFRHRFITNMVKAHLKSFMGEHPHKGRSLMTESDYRTILKRVATFTGHADEMSLWTYIDLAWEELGVFEDAKHAVAVASAVEGAINSISSIIGDANAARHLSGLQVADIVMKELALTRQSILDALSSRPPHGDGA